MMVYHGSNVAVNHPDIGHSFRPLDFGKGFYVTTIKEHLQYDLIKGKVANDKVFRVVDMYHSGIWDRERALKEMKVYPDYDQIAFISQKAINQLLNYESKAEWFKGTC